MFVKCLMFASIVSCDGHFVAWSWTICAVVNEGIMRNKMFGNILNLVSGSGTDDFKDLIFYFSSGGHFIRQSRNACAILVDHFMRKNPINRPWHVICNNDIRSVAYYSSDLQRLLSDCTHAQVGLRLCWSHIPHCWKAHAAAHLFWIGSVVWVEVLFWDIHIFTLVAIFQWNRTVCAV